MKIWKLTLRRSSGVKNTLRQSQSLQSFSRKNSEKMKHCNCNPEIANAGAPRTTSTPSPSMSAFSPHLHQFRHDLQAQAIPELHPDSRTLLVHIHKNFFFKGTWRLIEMAKCVLAEPTTDTASAWMKWSPHAGSHFSQKFHGIATLDYQLLDLYALLIYYVLITILMNLSASNDISMIFQGTVEERN